MGFLCSLFKYIEVKLVKIGKFCSGSCDLGQRPSYAYNGSYISKNISEPVISSKVVALAMLHGYTQVVYISTIS